MGMTPELHLKEAGITYRDAVQAVNELQQAREQAREVLMTIEDKLEAAGKARSAAHKALIAAAHQLK